MEIEIINCTECQQKDVVYIGTGLKFAVTITANGFSMDDDEWSVLFKTKTSGCEVGKEDCTPPDVYMDKYSAILTEDNAWIVPLDTTALKPGMLVAVVTARVPDNEFPSGIRKEITVTELLMLANA